MQALLNGLVSGLLIALPAIALSLTYGILNFANFSIGAMITTGAYLAYIANTSLGAPNAVAAPAAAIGLALVAIAIQHGVYRRIRNADHVTLLVASMGVAFVLENVLRFFGRNLVQLPVLDGIALVPFESDAMLQGIGGHMVSILLSYTS